MSTEARVLRTGDKVRINVGQITGYKDYKRFIPEYRRFVEKSEGKIFTAKKEGGLFTFKELSDMRYSWLFHPDDLIPVEAVGE